MGHINNCHYNNYAERESMNLLVGMWTLLIQFVNAVTFMIYEHDYEE